MKNRSYWKATTTLLAASTVLYFAPVNAAIITWSDATDTTVTTNISNSGNLVKAFNSGGSGVTLNNVTFAQFATAGDDVWNSFDALYPGLVGINSVFDDQADLGAFNPLLSTANFLAPVGGGSHAIELQNLAVGTQYELQLFFADQRGSINSLPAGCLGCNDREVTFSSGVNSVTLEADPGNSATSPFGQFTLGSFLADSTNQAFTIYGPEVQQINAWQLRSITDVTPPVPEPEIYAMMGIGFGLVGWVARKKKRNHATA